MTDLDQLAAIQDPAERARACQAELERLDVLRADVAAIRNQAIAELRGSGLPLRKIGETIGLSHEAVGRALRK